ncbi:hypothetical protein GQ457_15G015330 [Hibiscus cannabinus]
MERQQELFEKKKYFKNNLNHEEKLQNVPPEMHTYQWEDAVRFWSSTKGEARERVGVASRQQQKFTHNAGSKSFARVAEEHDKLRDKRAEYEATGSSHGSINDQELENQVIAEVLGFYLWIDTFVCFSCVFAKLLLGVINLGGLKNAHHMME